MRNNGQQWNFSSFIGDSIEVKNNEQALQTLNSICGSIAMLNYGTMLNIYQFKSGLNKQIVMCLLIQTL